MMTKLVRPECPLCHTRSHLDNAFSPTYMDGLEIDPVRSMFYPPRFHWDCYLSWSDRDAFATGLFNRLVVDGDRSTLDGRSYVDGDLAIFIPVYATICKPYPNKEYDRTRCF